MTILTDSAEVEAAWIKQYETLAHEFVGLFNGSPLRIAEVGCGSGRFTLPFASWLPSTQFVLVDAFANARKNYALRRYKTLMRNLKSEGLEKRARVVVSDYLKWIRAEDEESYHGIVSCEFLPEIASTELELFVQECYRILKYGGITAHCFLSPSPRNAKQKLVIEADSNPAWTRTPPREWFSPPPNLLLRELRKCGFHRISRTTIRSRLILRADAAKRMLRSWNVRASFAHRFKERLSNVGLEIPDWIIISAHKS